MKRKLSFWVPVPKEKFWMATAALLMYLIFCCEYSLRQVWTMTHSLSFRDNAAKAWLRMVF